MTAEYEILTSTVSPMGLLSALGIEFLGSRDGSHSTFVVRGDSYKVSDLGFIASDTNGIFHSGGCVDFAALYVFRTKGFRGLKAYVEGVRLMINSFSKNLPDLVKNIDSVSHDVGREAFARRRIYDILRLNSKPPAQVSSLVAIKETTLRKLGIDRSLSPGSVSIITPKDWKDLRDAASSLGVNLPDISTFEAHIVIPYYSDYGTVSYIELSGDNSHMLQLEPSRIAFSGLTSMLPGYRILLHSSSIRAASISSDMLREGSSACCMAIQLDMSKPKSGWTPPEVTFVDEGSLILSETALLDNEGINVLTTPYADIRMIDQYGCLNWRDQMVDRILDKFKKTKGKIDVEAKRILEVCRHNLTLRHSILAALYASEFPGLDFRVRQLFHDGLLISNNSTKIYNTSNGYKYCNPARGEDGPIYELSNFTMQLNASIVFPEEASYFHRVTINLPTSSHEVVIQGEDLESSKKLDKAVKQACLCLDINQTPVITDLTAARHLIPYWRSLTGVLPREDGLSFVGWDGLKESFHGPSFTIGKDIIGGHKLHHPGVNVLRYYGGTDVQPVLHHSLPVELADLISQAIAMQARVFSGHPVRPVLVLNTANSHKALRVLFEGLGQTHPIELNSNQRALKELPGLRGYPAYALGYTPSQSKSSIMPLFMLSDRGLRMHDKHSSVDLKAAGEMLRYLVEATALHMLEDGSYYNRQHSVLYESELAREGAHLVCTIAGLPEWPISHTQYELLESILRKIPPAQIQMYFDHDLQRQKVYFHYRRLQEKVDKQDLYMQLSPLVQEMGDREGFFEIDAVSAVEILNNFYQGEAILKPVNLPTSVVESKVV